jgi:GTP-binding protein
MKIIDHAEITVSSGDGGNGAVAFRREKHVPNGGPSGGDGGRGGAVIIESSANLHTLLDFRYQHRFKAEHGKNGGIKNLHGRGGEDLVILVPPGTQVRDKESGKMLFDLTRAGQRVIVAPGGKGGKGNARFVSAVYQAPRYAEPGEPGVQRVLVLELKTIADVGLVGLPNAGKSSLLAAVSAARPKIANYPFTTLRPNLGSIRFPEGDGFVMADIPGLIEGASEGIGLGHDFLRHVERTRLLVHLVDMSDPDPVENYHVIQKELANYPAKLSDKKQILVLNKSDLKLPEEVEDLKQIFEKITGEPVQVISAATQQGTQTLIRTIQQQLALFPPIPESELEVPESLPRPDKDFSQFEVFLDKEIYVVESEALERLLNLSDLQDSRALQRFHKQMEKMGVIDALKEAGASSGDTVRIGWLEFDYL